MPATKNMGRPRDPKIQKKILKATQAIILERGYPGLSIEGVSVLSGVARNTIYRRWSSTFELVAAVLDEADQTWPVMPPTTGNIEEDLVLLYRNWLSGVTGPGRVIAVLIAGAVQNNELADLVREKFIQPRLIQVHGIIEKAIARRELPKKTDIVTAIDMFLGRMWYRLLITGDTIKLDDERKVVQMLLEGLKARN